MNKNKLKKCCHSNAKNANSNLLVTEDVPRTALLKINKKSCPKLLMSRLLPF